MQAICDNFENVFFVILSSLFSKAVDTTKNKVYSVLSLCKKLADDNFKPSGAEMASFVWTFWFGMVCLVW